MVWYKRPWTCSRPKAKSGVECDRAWEVWPIPLPQALLGAVTYLSCRVGRCRGKPVTFNVCLLWRV